MFEGTDLSMAYGFSEPVQPQAPIYSPQIPPQSPPPMPAVQSMNQPPQQPPKQMVSVQQPNELPYNPPEQMYMQQPAPVVYEQDTFFQRIANSRYDVLKVVVFAMIILFAISMDRLITHYLCEYVTGNILTAGQEFIVRLSYPIAILLVIWFVKAM